MLAEEEPGIMRQTPERSRAVAIADAKFGRTDPPMLMFQPLRTRSLERLDAGSGLAAKILCIVAPVGYGKTVLMSMLLADLRRAGKQCLWFALDEQDTAAENVIGALEAMLNGRETELHPTQVLFRGHEPVGNRVEALLDLVERYPLPITLFIDNLNCCTDAALHRLLDGLAFRTRATVQLVLSSTRDIPLDISRAQLAGMIRLIGPADLGFDVGEVSNLLGPALCARIGQPGVETVARQTEGWPAAVRMAQIILSNAEQPHLALKAFSGSDEALAHLLNRKVLSGFPDEVREFLFCVAQLRTFSLELCSHAVGSDRAAEHLAYLLDRNVFLIPLDRNRSWYRLHGLFRDHLLHEAERFLSARRRREVLVRAARWCEKNGQWRESVDYALASGSTATACQILEHKAPVFVRDRGDLMQYIKWIETLHDQGHLAGPEAEYWFAWALAFHRRYDYARQQCASLAARVQRQQKKTESGKASALQRRIAILRTSIDSLSDRLQDAHRSAAQWLAGVDAGTDDPFNVAVANCMESCFYAGSFRFVEARRAIEAAREAAFQANSAHVDGWVSTYAALIAIYEGNYAAAYPELVAALAATRAALGDDTGICGTMAMVAAKCAAEMGLSEETWQLLDFGIRTSRTHGFLEATACGLEAAVLIWSGDKDDHVSIPLLNEIAGSYPPRLSLMLSCYLVRRLVVLGRVDEASELAERIGLTTGGAEPRNREPLAKKIAYLETLIENARIDLLIASGRFKQAELLIAEETRRARATHRASRLVGLALASAQIAARSGQQTLALRHITRAVSIAATRCIVRPFNEHAETLASVVADTKVGEWGFATKEERRFFVDRCRQLTFADPSLYDKLLSLHQEAPHLADHLTARELELIGHIDTGFSNQQIADRINVSLHTVKWHLQNMYAKLGVTNRSAALAKARVLNLLSR